MIHRIEDPLVSVIIPTYNRGWCLNEAVDSVFSQTYERYELIVVDDGSEDDTGKCLSRYKDITVITQHNRGVSAARNRGIAAARGELSLSWIPTTSGCRKNFPYRWRFFRQIPKRWFVRPRKHGSGMAGGFIQKTAIRNNRVIFLNAPLTCVS